MGWQAVVVLGGGVVGSRRRMPLVVRDRSMRTGTKVDSRHRLIDWGRRHTRKPGFAPAVEAAAAAAMDPWRFPLLLLPSLDPIQFTRHTFSSTLLFQPKTYGTIFLVLVS
ncbi:hypothetical protein DM860_016648 [Cuscuta australis]|uniref:Uncharacterized protein n=1 Tax=Cuscuta australis TaxID=267555 RepID=A0A328DKD8_9ASTE|nr:hypothetical protein DM860_016648 [Cuscuta australis]